MFRLCYSISVNDQSPYEIYVEAPDWLPVTPCVRHGWIVPMIKAAIREATSINAA